MIREAIEKIVMKDDLTYDEAYAVMGEIMRAETSVTQNAAFLAALSTKSTKAETIDEISGCAAAMRELATPVEHPGIDVLEIVGTGGDRANTFNISTTAALLCTAAGAKVAKHGNRAANPQVPCAVGFGISTPEQAARMAAAADGTIVGSAIVRMIGAYGDACVEPVAAYVHEMAAAVHSQDCKQGERPNA